MRKVAVLGIDLGKNSCSLAGWTRAGAVVLRRRMSREGILALRRRAAGLRGGDGGVLRRAPPRPAAARRKGHEVRLMSPEYVRPYVKAQKNDDRDAEAIAEAATRPTMRFVALKSEAQLDLQTLHRARDRLVGQRTALINQLRAILLERGIIVPQGRRKLEQALAALIGRRRAAGSAPGCGPCSRTCAREWRELDRRIAASTTSSPRWPATTRRRGGLATIPGIGVLNATALVAAIGDGRTFARGRDLAAWLGLVPRQATTGGKPRLLGITKRGNSYLRKLLIHGARAALPSLSRRARRRSGAWLRGLLARAHRNAVVVALATKLARIAWAVLRSGGRLRGEARRPRSRRNRPPASGGARPDGDVCGWWKRDGLTVDRRPGSLAKNGATTPTLL